MRFTGDKVVSSIPASTILQSIKRQSVLSAYVESESVRKIHGSEQPDLDKEVLFEKTFLRKVK